jgi:hypothetical protein
MENRIDCKTISVLVRMQPREWYFVHCRLSVFSVFTTRLLGLVNRHQLPNNLRMTEAASLQLILASMSSSLPSLESGPWYWFAFSWIANIRIYLILFHKKRNIKSRLNLFFPVSQSPPSAKESLMVP